MRALGWMCLLALALPAAAGAAAKKTYEDKGFQLTPFGGWTNFDSQLQYANGEPLKDAGYIGGRVGLRLAPILWLDVAGGLASTKPDAGGDDVSWSHGSGNLMFSTKADKPLRPFLSLGGGWMNESHEIASDVSAGTFELAGGLLYHLTDLLGLRLEVRNILRIPDSGLESADKSDLVYGAGLSFGFGGGNKDTDQDGVPDKKDKCPDTPKGCNVDLEGCPIDADKDGVCDGLDQCPNTPVGAKVDARGCPTDSDGDGIFDGLDRCADTPAGCRVDKDGCPIDTDSDGVCDGVDQCANTPLGCTVDARGCPLDSDGDGVCDGLDKCPNTTTGLRVDKDGCPIEVMERTTELLDTGMIRISDINFASGKADIPADAESHLQVVGEVLSQWPDLKIEVGGHTDSRGEAAFNQKLSQKRAAAVRDYLLAHNPQLKAEQITARGYGEAKPVSPNTTALNMAKNRRVEFKVLNKEQLRRVKEQHRMLQQNEAAPDTTKR